MPEELSEPSRPRGGSWRRVADLALWVLLLALPAFVAIGGPRHDADARVEQAFVDTLGLSTGAEPEAAPARSLAPAYYSFFFTLQERLGTPGWLGQPLSVGVAWLLFATAFAVLVAGAIGNLAAACSLVLLVFHPQVRGMGALMTPWLPAMSFTMLGLAFLQGLVLPTVILRRASPGRWGPRLLAITGCGLSLGLASSAEGRIGWIMLIPGFLLALSVVAVGLTLWRVRNVVPPAGFLINPWAIVRRTFPWAVCWFLVLLLLIEIHAALEDTRTEQLSRLVAGPATLERVLAWVALPGILWLGYREGQRLGFRSQLGGSTVLFVCLSAMWLVGPALHEAAGPLERLLGAPVTAASLASWIRWRD